LPLIGSFFGGMTAFWFLFVPIIGSTLITLVYSYVLYQREVKACQAWSRPPLLHVSRETDGT
jgi:hypothetical protein